MCAQRSKHTKGRLKPEHPCPVRMAFQHDRDRILHSKSFRRLKYKTQVLLLPEGDHYRTRLTHTLEVSQVARTIARALRLNEDLVESISLGHDLGHTPFGHAGEEVLNKILPDGFRHYEQSLRVVDILEKNGEGLNLTYEVRDGILKHSKGRGKILGGKDLPITLEGKVIRVADIIAYLNHDLDDAIRAGVLKTTDIPERITHVLGKTYSKRINSMVMDVIQESTKRGNSDIFISSEMLDTMNTLRDFLYERVYESNAMRNEFQKCSNIIQSIFEYYERNPDSFYSDSGYNISELNTQEKKRRIADFIAGMTDRYALSKFSEIYIPHPWH